MAEGDTSSGAAKRKAANKKRSIAGSSQQAAYVDIKRKRINTHWCHLGTLLSIEAVHNGHCMQKNSVSLQRAFTHVKSLGTAPREVVGIDDGVY